MANTFYNDFDQEHLAATNPDYRAPFQRDYDRLVHNAAFRRLQAKTQVFLSGEYDFYRTRLTHSIEVAQIAGSIARYLNSTSPLLNTDFHIDETLVEACALAHDIGHPPFGHAGENTLHRLMLPHGGFEGNAQTLRLLTETIFTSGSDRRGLNPTRAFVDGVMKYKTLFNQLPEPVNHFLFDDQQKYLEFICAGHTWPADLSPGKSINAFRSLECQIMDWADDTAYSLNDLVDSAQAGFVTMEKIARWARSQKLEPTDLQTLDTLQTSIADGDLERAMNRKIGRFIEACSLGERQNFLSEATNRYRFELHVDPVIAREQRLYAQLAKDLVFRSPQVCQLEHKGGWMLERLFQALWENYQLPAGTQQPLLSAAFEQEMARTGPQDGPRARLICDYLAGMTDGFASRSYRRLFDPDFGSIVDLV